MLVWQFVGYLVSIPNTFTVILGLVVMYLFILLTYIIYRKTFFKK